MSAFTFQVDVSRTYRNKEGYGPGKSYRLNTSFKTETHTPETFLDSVIRPGWPYTMVFNHDRSPAETGAAARGVVTPKHTENFISRQELTGDIDNKQAKPGVIDFWLHDSFFSRYGWAFVESVNSRPEAQKGHPTLIFDRPITCDKLWKECMQAWIWQRPELDPAVAHSELTVFNRTGATVHLLGNICPFDVFEREVLMPYRAHLKAQAELEAKYQAQRKAEIEQARADGRIRTDAGAFENYLANTLDGIFRFVADQPHNRHKVIYWAGQKVGALTAAPWTAPYFHLFAGVDSRIVEAAQINGYFATYAHDSDTEVLRTFNDGRRFGAAHPADQPELYERKPTPPAQPGPKELERRAQVEAYKAQAQAEREAKEARKEAHYQPGLIPFMLAPDEYETTVYPARQTFSSAAAWREHCVFEFPELDPDHEYRVKLEENRERKMSFCGRPFKRLTALGEIKSGRILCGLCESCKKLDRLNLRRALEEAILNDPEQCLFVVTVDCKAQRARIARRLRENGHPEKVFPVASDSTQADYDIILPSAAAHLVGEYEPQELLLLHLNDARLNRWLETPEGERQSGKLIPSRRELREIGEPDRFEIDSDSVYFDKTNGKWFIHREQHLRFKDEPFDPEAFELELPGIVAEGETPEVYYDGQAHDPQTLQKALFEMADRQRRIMWSKGHVIYGVIIKRSHYPLNDVPAICELFNTGNETRRAKFEARRRKKRE